MSRRILTSLLTILVAAVVVVGATRAFFSDTETSTGNVLSAGAIDLTIDNVQHYNGMICAELGDLSHIWVPEANATLDVDNHPEVDGDFDQAAIDAYNDANPAQYPQAGVVCDGSWRLADIGPNAFQGLFFNFLDVKPGDVGENTVSIHVDSNDAWMCAALGSVGGEDPDETRTEPEAEVDTDTDTELPENLQFFAWWDLDGDNFFDQGEEAITPDPIPGDLVSNGVLPIADSGTGEGPISGGETHYIAVAWCAGDMAIPVAGSPIECDGEGVGNEAQTDSMTADIQFYAVQSRNNLDFTCEEDYQPEFPEI